MWSFTKIQKEISRHAVGTGDRLMYRPEVVDLLLNLIPRQIPVDEAYYLASNPDVSKAVENGIVRSGTEHFIEHGYFEDRLPMAISIDEADYLSRYPDVREGVDEGRVASATAHWKDYGRFEGRTALLKVEEPHLEIRKRA